MAGLLPYKRLIPANGVSTIGARGNLIVVRDVVGEVQITARQSKVSSKDAQSYTLTLRKFEKWTNAEEFDEVVVRNPDSQAKTIELLIGYGDFVREITSRSQVAKFIRTGLAEAQSGGAGNLPAVELLPENLQRKRVIIRLIESSVVS